MRSIQFEYVYMDEYNRRLTHFLDKYNGILTRDIYLASLNHENVQKLCFALFFPTQLHNQLSLFIHYGEADCRALRWSQIV
jgi:hypothetical protein